MSRGSRSVAAAMRTSGMTLEIPAGGQVEVPGFGRAIYFIDRTGLNSFPLLKLDLGNPFSFPKGMFIRTSGFSRAFLLNPGGSAMQCEIIVSDDPEFFAHFLDTGL